MNRFRLLFWKKMTNGHVVIVADYTQLSLAKDI